MMNRIPKAAYTTEFKDLAVKRVSDGEAISVDKEKNQENLAA